MLLVTGATGTIGHPLIDVLVNEGAKVRIITHSSQAAALPAEVEVVEGDLSRPAAIAPHLEGITALFLHPRAVGLAAVELVALARQRGCNGWWPCRRRTSTIPWTSSHPAPKGTGTRRSRTPPSPAALRG